MSPAPHRTAGYCTFLFSSTICISLSSFCLFVFPYSQAIERTGDKKNKIDTFSVLLLSPLVMTERRRTHSSRGTNNTTGNHHSNNNSGSDNKSGTMVSSIWSEDRKQQTIDWAIRLYDRIVLLDPAAADVSFLLLRSFCYAESGAFDAALTDALHVVDQWPDRPDGYFVKEKALAGLRKYLEADEAQKRVNELQRQRSGGQQQDNLTDVLKQQISRHWIVCTAAKDLDSESSDAAAAKSGRISSDKDDKKTSRKSSKHISAPSSKEEKKRSDKKRSPINDQATSSSSRPSLPTATVSSAAKMIESKVTKVEKAEPLQVRSSRRSKSPAIRRHAKEETSDRHDDSAGDNFEVVDDIHYPQYDPDLNIETAFTPPPQQPRPRSPHSPDEPMEEDRRPVQRNRSDGHRNRFAASPPAYPHSGDRKRIRVDRSPAAVARRADSRSPHHRRAGPFSNAGNARKSRSRSRSPVGRSNRQHHDLPINIYRLTAIRIRNIYPQINQKLLETVASRYGRVVNIETKDKEAIITYTDTESPRRAIADLHDTFVHRVSHFSDKLHVRFALGSNQDKFHMRNVKKVECDECHFYRTTGCEADDCPEKHIAFNAGIDLQPWMPKPRPGAAAGFRD